MFVSKLEDVEVKIVAQKKSTLSTQLLGQEIYDMHMKYQINDTN